MPRKENVLVALAWTGAGKGGDTFLRPSGPKGSRRTCVPLPTWGFLCCYFSRFPLHGAIWATEAQNSMKVTTSAKLAFSRKGEATGYAPWERMAGAFVSSLRSLPSTLSRFTSASAFCKPHSIWSPNLTSSPVPILPSLAADFHGPGLRPRAVSSVCHVYSSALT